MKHCRQELFLCGGSLLSTCRYPAIHWNKGATPAWKQSSPHHIERTFSGKLVNPATKVWKKVSVPRACTIACVANFLHVQAALDGLEHEELRPVQGKHRDMLRDNNSDDTKDCCMTVSYTELAQGSSKNQVTWSPCWDNSRATHEESENKLSCEAQVHLFASRAAIPCWKLSNTRHRLSQGTWYTMIYPSQTDSTATRNASWPRAEWNGESYLVKDADVMAAFVFSLIIFHYFLLITLCCSYPNLAILAGFLITLGLDMILLWVAIAPNVPLSICPVVWMWVGRPVMVLGGPHLITFDQWPEKHFCHTQAVSEPLQGAPPEHQPETACPFSWSHAAAWTPQALIPQPHLIPLKSLSASALI